MPVNNKYNHYDLSKNKTARQVASIPTFGGVDYSSQKFNVASNRAIDIKNYLYKSDGFIRKRNGHEQVFQIPVLEYTDAFTNTAFTNGTNFNGMWKFKAEDGEWHVIAHVGNLLFELKDIDNVRNIDYRPIKYDGVGAWSKNVDGQFYNPTCYKFEDYKSFAFVGANRLWFLGGNKFMCLRFYKNNLNSTVAAIYPVANRINASDETENTFIPTTTTSITYTDAILNKRTLLDYPNKLTYWRKNKLLSGVGKVEDEDYEEKSTYFLNYEYELDSPLIKGSTTDSDYSNVTVIIEYKEIINTNVHNDYDKITCHVEKATQADYGEDYTAPENGVLKIYYTDQSNVKHYVGFIADIEMSETNAKVVLYDDYTPPIDGTANIEITYPYHTANTAEEIDKCHFGALFGSNNAKNRLFLSGNPDIPNADWHSAEPNYTDYSGEKVLRTNGNFSYFSDESIMYYGETDNDIVGYEIVSNDKLLVLKNKSDKEKTVYFRTPITVKAMNIAGEIEKDFDGNEANYQEEFSLTKGNNSVAGISPKTIVNFNGDTLFISSENQLVGLDLEGIVGDNQRYANTRSKYVDRMLASLDLSNAVVWTDNTFLFISIKDFGILATHFKTYNSETRQYEWFFLTSENPTVFLEKDGVYFFGNDKGELYKYVKGQFSDIRKIYDKYPLTYSDGKLVVTQSTIDKIKECTHEVVTDDGVFDVPDYLTLRNINPTWVEDPTKKIFYKIATIGDNDDIYIDAEHNCLIVLNEELQLPQEVPYYFDITSKADGSDVDTVLTGEKLFFEQYEFEGEEEGDKYKVFDEDGDEVDLSEIYAAVLCGCLEDEEVEVTDPHESTGSGDYNTITLKKDGVTLNLVQYGSQQGTENFNCEIRDYQPVEALYICAPLTFGSLNNQKTIWSYTITNDTEIPSEIEVAYASNKIPLVDTKKMSYISLTKQQIGYYFGRLNFNSVDFDKMAVPRTYTFHRVLAQQKFICFVFRNYKDTDSVLCSMTVTYSVVYPAFSGD